MTLVRLHWKATPRPSFLDINTILSGPNVVQLSLSFGTTGFTSGKRKAPVNSQAEEALCWVNGQDSYQSLSP